MINRRRRIRRNILTRKEISLTWITMDNVIKENTYLQTNIELKDGNSIIVINCGAHPDSFLYPEFLIQHSIITGFPMCKTLYTWNLFTTLPYFCMTATRC